MAHTVCHVEFQAKDIEAAHAFYAAIFDWSFKPFGEDMITFGVGDEHIGGLIRSAEVSPASYASVWFQVEDIESTLAKASAAGGAVKSGKSPVPHVGWSAEFTDLDGNPVGIVQFER